MHDSSRREQLSRIFAAELGVRELSDKNDGQKVEEYLRYVNLRKGNPWCAAFVCWALGKAGAANPRSGWSPDLFPEKRVIWKNSRQLSISLPGNARKTNPQKGDVFGIYFSDKKRIAHCGFLESFGNTWAITVEGNTNAAGSRDGDGVYRKRRLTTSLYRISDWVEIDGRIRSLL